MEHILVTGGSGYLGSIICEHLLDEGYEVTVLDNLQYGQCSHFHLCNHPSFHFVRGDARDPSVLTPLLARADVIFPLAALVGEPACNADPAAAESLNLGAIRLLNEKRSAGQLVVFPMTNSGYGAKSGNVFCTEETPLEPLSIYGRTKVEAERLLLDSPNTITLRLATVFGCSPRMRIDLLVNHFVHAAVKDGYIVIFEKDFRRNFVHIRDVADCFIHAVKNGSAMRGRTYNLGNDAINVSKEQLALMVKAQVPNFYIHFASIGSDPDKRDYIVSNERLKQAGFEAGRSLDEGIQELIKGYQMMPRTVFRNGGQG
jgi:nucleoside-diphosphate-sugar epimerase